MERVLNAKMCGPTQVHYEIREVRDVCGLEWNLKIYLINFKGRHMEMLMTCLKKKKQKVGWFV